MRTYEPARRVRWFRTIGAREVAKQRSNSTVGNWLTVGMFISVCSVLSAPAQSWIPDGPPNWTSMSFETVGGITYFRYVAWVPGDRCRRVAAESPVSRSGTNLSQTISQEVWTGICLCDVINPCSHSETHVSIFGELPPGDYGFWITSVDLLNPPNPFPTFIPFSVPVSDNPTLSGWADINSATFKLAVEGVSNVTYVIQASSNLANWTSVATNVGGPFLWSEPLQPQVASRFYRTRIIGN
jgi:hypothetical protein